MGAPGPAAGVGLPFLLAAGGYGVWSRRRSRIRKAAKASET